MNAATLPLKKPTALLIPALLACYLVWGSTYLAIKFALLSLPEGRNLDRFTAEIDDAVDTFYRAWRPDPAC